MKQGSDSKTAAAHADEGEITLFRLYVEKKLMGSHSSHRPRKFGKFFKIFGGIFERYLKILKET